MKKLPLTIALLAACSLVQAKDTDISKLGTTLNPMGGEMAANADGTIPAWTGGMKPGAAPIEANGNYVNPFANEKPLYTITKDNLEQHKAFLSAGQQAMFSRFPDYKMNVYPTHRTARIPQKYLDQSRENVAKTELADGGNGLQHFTFGIPFPMPTEALEVVWNHIARYRGGSVKRQLSSATVQENGTYTIVDYDSLVAFRENITDLEPSSNVLFMTYTRTLNPSRYSGEVTLVHEPINQVAQTRDAWQYIPGQRRVRRAPTVSYDSSARYTFGQVVQDSVDGFNGAPDRYNWKLIGKKEMLVPYNAYKIMDKNLGYDDLLKVGHLNTDLPRYEKHRVWVIEADLKPGMRNVYAKRRFYIDEDSWSILATDLYDSRGLLWRTQENHLAQYHDIELPFYATDVTYDLISGRYASGMITIKDPKWDWGKPMSKAEFTPAQLKRLGK
ncbi:DUF1329 domain-containing protein [Pseudomonas sp. H9]|uniref:DUF1329 domain-containing protein n=1 Tax=Pseudomonas sp. H9 TaxID=483968 RepID=UPI00211425F6|nr:DUF1329 domain-containing protein [Pseudomonas sp. H9]